MGHTYSAHHLAQLARGQGEVLNGDGALVVLKALLQSGTAYLGGYPGAPTSSLIDAMASAYEPVLKPMGIYFEASGSEANAAALLKASIHHPVRGAVNWKVVGTNVAADALAHISTSGVTGGALVIVGEDYGCNSTVLAEETLPYGMKSTMTVLDPKGDLQHLADLVEHAFAISEASQMISVLLLRTRVGNLRGTIRCKDNVPPGFSILHPLEQIRSDINRLPMPPYSQMQERAKAEVRLPAARDYIRRHRLNELRPGADGEIGIISHGMLLNTTLRCLSLMGQADLTGASRIPILNLHVLHPLVPDELVGFMRGKKAVLLVEEGMPALLEEQIRAAAQRAKLSTEIFGKDVLSLAGEYTPEVVLKGLGDFLGEVETLRVAVPAGAPVQASPAGVGAGSSPGGGGRAGARGALPAAAVAAPPTVNGTGSRADEARARAEAILLHRQLAHSFLEHPVAKRTAVFCTGCPERPIFSALKILEREYGRAQYAGDIGCYTMGGLPPFSMSDSTVGMGLGLASANALSRLSTPRAVSFMGDGTFWHSGLTSSIANALYNKQDAVLVIFENFWTAMTGHQENPASHRNIRQEPVGKMDIATALRGVGVEWIDVVNPYDVGDSMRAFRKAFEAGEPGLRVIISRAECRLEQTRRERPLKLRLVDEGKRVETVKLGVDPEVCVGDHSCMRLNGCPSLTVRPGPNPLREDPVATIEPSCAGCGLCGEIAHEAVLCPSFYEVRAIDNPTALDRLRSRVSRALIGLACARA